MATGVWEEVILTSIQRILFKIFPSINQSYVGVVLRLLVLTRSTLHGKADTVTPYYKLEH